MIKSCNACFCLWVRVFLMPCMHRTLRVIVASDRSSHIAISSDTSLITIATQKSTRNGRMLVGRKMVRCNGREGNNSAASKCERCCGSDLSKCVTGYHTAWRRAIASWTDDLCQWHVAYQRDPNSMAADMIWCMRQTRCTFLNTPHSEAAKSWRLDHF